jgi:hypothetical protein
MPSTDAIVAAVLAFVAAAASGEAIARASRVPPERAATPIAPVPILNPGFESAAPGAVGAPAGWFVGQHAGPPSYTFTQDGDAPRSGNLSLRIDNVGPEPWGALDQVITATPWRGKTLRFSAWLRTRNAAGNAHGAGAGLAMQTRHGGYVVDQVRMRTDAVAGTTDWARYEVHLEVARTADQIEVGVNLFGPGSVWIDDVALDVVDPPAAATAKANDARPDVSESRP